MARKILRFKQINPLKTSAVMIVSQNANPTANIKEQSKIENDASKAKIDNSISKIKQDTDSIIKQFKDAGGEYYGPAFDAVTNTLTLPSIAQSNSFKNTMDAAGKIYDQSGADAAGKYLNSMSQLYRDNLDQFKNINTACTFLNKHYGTSQYNLDWVIDESSKLGILHKTANSIDNQLQLVNAKVGDLILDAINIANNIAEESPLSAVEIALRLPARIGRNPERNAQILSVFGNDTLFGLNPFKNILEADKNPGVKQNNISMLVMMEAFTAGTEKAVELIKKLQEFFGFLDTDFSKELYQNAVVAEKLQLLSGSQLEAIKTTWFEGNLAVFEKNLSLIIPMLRKYQKQNMIHDLGQISNLIAQSLAASALLSATSSQSTDEQMTSRPPTRGSKFLKYRYVIAQDGNTTSLGPNGDQLLANKPEISNKIKEVNEEIDQLVNKLIQDKGIIGQGVDLLKAFGEAMKIKGRAIGGFILTTLNSADIVKKIEDTFNNITVPAINSWAEQIKSLKVDVKTYKTMSDMISVLSDKMNDMFNTDPRAIQQIQDSLAKIFGTVGKTNMPASAYSGLVADVTRDPIIYQRIIQPIKNTLAMWSAVLSSIGTDAFVQPALTQSTQETSSLEQRPPAIMDMARLQEAFKDYRDYVDAKIFTSKDFLSSLTYVLNLVSPSNLSSHSKLERMEYKRMLLEVKSGLLKILRSRLDAEVYAYKLPLENKLRINSAKKRKLEEHEKLLMGKSVPYAPYAITIAIQQLVQTMAQDYDIFINELGGVIKDSKNIAALVSQNPLDTFFGSGAPLQRNIINFLSTEINNAESAKTAILAEAFSRKTGKEQGLV